MRAEKMVYVLRKGHHRPTWVYDRQLDAEHATKEWWETFDGMWFPKTAEDQIVARVEVEDLTRWQSVLDLQRAQSLALQVSTQQVSHLTMLLGQHERALQEEEAHLADILARWGIVRPKAPWGELRSRIVDYESKIQLLADEVRRLGGSER